jgi:hypothetical protein
MDSSIAQRREEILAKKAKLAELKKQRELRKAEHSQRQSLTGSPAREVRDDRLQSTLQSTLPCPPPLTIPLPDPLAHPAPDRRADP